ncbi:hypothetical protein ACVWZA_003901 [Sphingomonas sp. UYAg733]
MVAVFCHVKERVAVVRRCSAVITTGQAELNRSDHSVLAPLCPGPPRPSNHPQLRVTLRENAFLGFLREAAGKTAGISTRPHGNFTQVLREYRELMIKGMVCSIPGLLDSNIPVNGLLPAM